MRINLTSPSWKAIKEICVLLEVMLNLILYWRMPTNSFLYAKLCSLKITNSEQSCFNFLFFLYLYYISFCSLFYFKFTVILLLNCFILSWTLVKIESFTLTHRVPQNFGTVPATVISHNAQQDEKFSGKMTSIWFSHQRNGQHF